jgi:signal transduction histidine kinase
MAGSQLLPDALIEQVAQRFKLLSEPMRLQLLNLLQVHEEMSVQEVVEATGHRQANVSKHLGLMARESGVTVEAHLPEGPVEVPANRDELYQVFQNLLENACKYGASGGRVEIMLEDHRRKEPPEVAVTIRDYGPGIAREHIPRITERFYRVDVETSRAQKGTGLGLAIVKHILTRHNARLSIQSEPGEGASFTVHLPASSERATGNHS